MKIYQEVTRVPEPYREDRGPIVETVVVRYVPEDANLREEWPVAYLVNTIVKPYDSSFEVIQFFERATTPEDLKNTTITTEPVSRVVRDAIAKHDQTVVRVKKLVETAFEKRQNSVSRT